jgi:hypothetical protein
MFRRPLTLKACFVFFAALHESAFGPKRTPLAAPHMSAFGGKADITAPDKTATASLFLTIDVLQTASFLGCVPSETSHIELSAQQGDVKMVILESV